MIVQARRQWRYWSFSVQESKKQTADCLKETLSKSMYAGKKKEEENCWFGIAKIGQIKPARKSASLWSGNAQRALCEGMLANVRFMLKQEPDSYRILNKQHLY